MSSTPPSRPLPPPRASGDNDSVMLSPLMTLMPTGYRNIQPFQKGKGWHTNGRTPRRRAAGAQSSDEIDTEQHFSPEKERGVVFPPLPGQEMERTGSQGPSVSAVESAAIPSGDDRQEHDEGTSRPVIISPRAPSTPPKAVAPRRPSRTDIRGASTSGGSFRSRALSGSPSNGNSRPTSPATTTSNEENIKLRGSEKTQAVPGPDPVIMQQLWQEYAARSHAANRTVDAAAYHEKMHRRYGEQRALKERIAQLEQALDQMTQERNQAQAREDAAAKQLELLVSSESSGINLEASSSTHSSFLRPLQPTEPVNAEEKSYRERSFALERALSQAKTSLVAVREQLQQQTAQTNERLQALQAQLALEQKSSLELARQLRETSVSFTRVSSELVETRVALEREQQRIQEVTKQAQLHNAQLLSDTRRAQLETRMRLAVRSLGREAMRHKLEAFMSRTLRAEQNMRAAQLETENVRSERDAIREQLEHVLSSHAIKYHYLGAVGGVPGILERGTTLSNGARMVSGQLLVLQVLYEESEEPEDSDDCFCVHFVAYEPRSAQDDFLTFLLRDIQRLVPNHDSFLASHSVRRRERLEELSELLLNHVHAGYKNGHLVLAEISGPEAATQLPRELIAAQQELQSARQVTVYRGTRYIPVVDLDAEDDSVLAELNISEAFAPATSQIWWLEVHAVMLGNEGIDTLAMKVDLRRLLTFCATFGSYRPSESLVGGNKEDPEVFAVHEALLEPLFNRLRVVISEDASESKLELVELECDSRPPSTAESRDTKRALSVEIVDDIDILDTKKSEVSALDSIPSTLTYQCVVNVGDVFYCVRLQELWDGELLLDITMDDPDTQHHFHRILDEQQLANLAARLVQEGAIEFDEDDNREELEAAVLQVKYGLARALHRPLCKLVKRYVQPVLPHPSHGKRNTAAVGKISLGTLFENEESSEVVESKTQAFVLNSVGSSYHHRELRVLGVSRGLLFDEPIAYQLMQKLLTREKDSSDVDIQRHRTSHRFHASVGYSLVQTLSATLPSYGNVSLIDVLPFANDDTRLPLVLVLNGPKREQDLLLHAFKTIGLVDTDNSAQDTGGG